MRGKLFAVTFACNASGITPADAGKTVFDDCVKLTFKDHPRGCGENRTDRKSAAGRLGSPPRMRGKH